MHERPPGERDHWTFGSGALAFLLTILGIGITVPAFLQLYRTITGLLDPYMANAWIVPVCGEIAFAFLFLNGVLLQLRKAPGGGVRTPLMFLLVGSSVLLQVYASGGHRASVVGHLVVVVAFFGVMSVGKATIMSLRGGKIRADAITLGEWVAHPVHSFRLWRWMKAWGEPSRDRAQDRYMRLLLAISVAQEDPYIGSGWGWRRKLPVTLRYELATGHLPAQSGDDWPEAIASHVRKQLPSVRALVSATVPAPVPAAVESPAPAAVATPAETPSKPVSQRKPRRPSANEIRAMRNGADLVPYIEAHLGLDPIPPQGKIEDYFHVGRQKAREAVEAIRAEQARPTATVRELARR